MAGVLRQNHPTSHCCWYVLWEWSQLCCKSMNFNRRLECSTAFDSIGCVLWTMAIPLYQIVGPMIAVDVIDISLVSDRISWVHFHIDYVCVRVDNTRYIHVPCVNMLYSHKKAVVCTLCEIHAPKMRSFKRTICCWSLSHCRCQRHFCPFALYRLSEWFCNKFLS